MHRLFWRLTISSRWMWLAGLAIVLLIRFPVNFILHPPYLMDFEVYRAVAERIVHGDARHLYAPTTSDVMLFKYAPCWGLLWSPFAWVPKHAGAAIWATLTVLWLILSCWGADVLCQRAGLRPPPWLSVLVVLLLVRPIIAEFLNGQVDILWGLLVIGFLIAESSNHRWRSAVLLALAITLKLPALIFLPYLLCRGRLRAAARTVAVGLAANLATSLLLCPRQPLELVVGWMRVLWTSGGSRAFEIGNQSLLALAGRFLSSDGYRLNILSLPSYALFLVAIVVAVALFSLVCVGKGSQLEEFTRIVFDGSLLTVLMVLCSPTTWIATYSALILPAAVGFACIATHRAMLRRVLPAVALIALAVLSIMTLSGFWHAIGVRYFRQESYVYLVLMVLPWFGLTMFSLLWWQRRSLLSAAPAPSSTRGTSRS